MLGLLMIRLRLWLPAIAMGILPVVGPVEVTSLTFNINYHSLPGQKTVYGEYIMVINRLALSLLPLTGLGLTGVPVFNVNNNCSSGSTALMMARYLVQAGHECTLAVG